MANIKIAGYENIYVVCDHCSSENVYNRASDGIGDEVDNKKNIACNKCGKLFNIGGDEIVSATYQWFFNDLKRLKENKEYRMYILHLCQGCECFFRQAIVNRLIDRNSAFRDQEGRVHLENIQSSHTFKSLASMFEVATFSTLKNKFLSQYSWREDSGSLSKMKHDRRKTCFENINKTKIDRWRNRVVHSSAYRPSLDEINSFEQLRSDVVWLGQYLKLEESIYILNDRVD